MDDCLGQMPENMITECEREPLLFPPINLYRLISNYMFLVDINIQCIYIKPIIRYNQRLSVVTGILFRVENSYHSQYCRNCTTI